MYRDELTDSDGNAAYDVGCNCGCKSNNDEADDIGDQGNEIDPCTGEDIGKLRKDFPEISGLQVLGGGVLTWNADGGNDGCRDIQGSETAAMLLEVAGCPDGVQVGSGPFHGHLHLSVSQGRQQAGSITHHPVAGIEGKPKTDEDTSTLLASDDAGDSFHAGNTSLLLDACRAVCGGCVILFEVGRAGAALKSFAVILRRGRCGRGGHGQGAREGITGGRWVRKTRNVKRRKRKSSFCIFCSFAHSASAWPSGTPEISLIR